MKNEEKQKKACLFQGIRVLRCLGILVFGDFFFGIALYLKFDVFLNILSQNFKPKTAIKLSHLLFIDLKTIK